MANTLDSKFIDKDGDEAIARASLFAVVSI